MTISFFESNCLKLLENGPIVIKWVGIDMLSKEVRRRKKKGLSSTSRLIGYV